MADIILLENLTAETIAQANLPIIVYFAADPEPDASHMYLVKDATHHAYNGLPVFKVMYAEFGEPDEGTGAPGWGGFGEEVFISEDHARAALLERAQSTSLRMPSAPSARTQIAELVQQSFEKTLGQPGASLGSILSAQLGAQLSLNVNERGRQMFANFVGETSVYYDGKAAHAAFNASKGDVILPTWKWMEIKVAYVALLMIDWHQRGEPQTWDYIWDTTGPNSPEVKSGLSNLLSDHPPARAREDIAPCNASSMWALFWLMAKASLDVQEGLAKKETAA